MKDKPKITAAYRAMLSCRVGRDALEGKNKYHSGLPSLEYAMYNLLHAVEEIANALQETYDRLDRLEDKP